MEKILTEPKNAITKQYKKLFELDGVKLSYEKEAIHEVAKRSIERKTGARGLRAIMESIMMNAMYEVPSNEEVVECVITKASVDGKEEPLLISKDEAKRGVPLKKDEGEIA